ncbi:MAG TPA: hypothetical protein PKA30_05380 [Accumulibacter sp.]|uniref:hypothetical protein n=1 Tax=Accumulibacter sp. TaxID=2053492 RepID=UPI00287B0BCA|nr:hypothetical protein [Accumulibacter sp.]MDS4053625.1 hypothetical protein [Accumulibacter sp.]HMV04965.1 hypothetical protein [Accumulibacter sp.]HMW62920.1 hypothetical protein [Accumulibacter sp.]HMW79115.1 hypothetical protein [Accumulibacter sp.]HMX68776.1 hypothetical protein [Accumulibacter sp.]
MTHSLVPAPEQEGGQVAFPLGEAIVGLAIRLVVISALAQRLDDNLGTWYPIASMPILIWRFLVRLVNCLC